MGCWYTSGRSGSVCSGYWARWSCIFWLFRCCTMARKVSTRSTVHARFSNPATVQLRSHARVCPCATWLWARAIVSRLRAPHAKCGLTTRQLVADNMVRDDTQLSLSIAAWRRAACTNRRAQATSGSWLRYCDGGTQPYKSGRQASALLLLVGVPFGIDQSVVRCPLLGDWNCISSMVKSIRDKWSVRCTKVSPLLVRYWRIAS